MKNEFALKTSIVYIVIELISGAPHISTCPDKLSLTSTKFVFIFSFKEKKAGRRRGT